MIRIYLAAAVVAAIFLAYIAGAHIGNVRCDSQIADAISAQIAFDTKIMDETNETVMHTGVGNIRRVLREKYTIVE